ncbi:MAG: HAD family phosphatase [Solobacterium sp.]|nr:HAD family phosphatase [Solobacterium sp.]
MIKAVIFDMDGVLIDAKEWHYEALNKALRLFGYEISRQEHLQTYDGLPTRKKLEMLTLEKGLPAKLHPFINDLKQQYTIDRVYADCYPKFVHQYALSRLKREGYRLACASNSIRLSVELMMNRSDLMQYLEFYLSNQDVSKPKPDPEIYTVSIERLGLKPEECLIIEDNFNGIMAAERSGAHVMKVETVYDVNYDNIRRAIAEAEKGA